MFDPYRTTEKEAQSRLQVDLNIDNLSTDEASTPRDYSFKKLKSFLVKQVVKMGRP